jgi:hypothetical protein
LTQKHELCSWPLLDHGFQEDNALEGVHVKGHTLIMDSKISLLDGTTMLWKEYILRATIGVGRLGSNIPIEEITMSTTRSRSEEVENTMRGSFLSTVEGMGHVTT